MNILYALLFVDNENHFVAAISLEYYEAGLLVQIYDGFAFFEDIHTAVSTVNSLRDTRVESLVWCESDTEENFNWKDYYYGEKNTNNGNTDVSGKE